MTMGYEQSLIGTVLHDPQSWVEVMDLVPQDFGVQQHRVIWQHIQDLAPRGVLSVRTLTEALRDQNQLESIGGEKTRGEEYLHELFAGADLVGLKEFRTRVKDASTKRRLESLGVLLVQEARNGKTVQEIIDEHMQRVLEVSTDDDKEPELIGAGLRTIKEEFELRRQGKLKPKWVPYLEALQEVVPGLMKADFAITAATPGSGKSSFLRTEALRGALDGKKVLFLSYENTIEETTTWSLAYLSKVNHKHILFPQKFMSNAEHKAVNEAWERLENLPWLIAEMAGDPLATVRRIARQQLMRGGLDIIMIDGMYLMGGASDSKYEVITSNSQGLRSLAQELKVPIWATTQFNRQVRVNDPDQSELLYAGENPARVIISMIPRKMEPHEYARFPENRYYEPSGRLITLQGKRARAVVIKANVLKQTNGELGPTGDVKWDKATGRFLTLQPDWNRSR